MSPHHAKTARAIVWIVLGTTARAGEKGSFIIKTYVKVIDLTCALVKITGQGETNSIALRRRWVNEEPVRRIAGFFRPGRHDRPRSRFGDNRRDGD